MTQPGAAAESGGSFASGGWPCAGCGVPLPPRALVCPACGTLVFRDRLQQLANEASRQEWIDPMRAAVVWRQCLELLPTDSEQYRQVTDRAAALAGGAVPMPGLVPAGNSSPQPPVDPDVPRGRRAAPETWRSILLKTGGSMAFNIYIYKILYKDLDPGWTFSIGFVLMLLIHELGHSLAIWYFGMRQSPPIFVPFMGALIILRENPRDARVESVIGIAGPVSGTVGVLIAFAWFMTTGNPIIGTLAAFGAFLNLFNLLPCPPLDGGRVSSAIAPFLWVPGLLGFVGILGTIWWQSHQRKGGGFDYVAVLLVFWILRTAIPRVWKTVRSKWWQNPYYQVGWPTRAAMSASYVVLAALLIYVWITLNQMLGGDGSLF